MFVTLAAADRQPCIQNTSERGFRLSSTTYLYIYELVLIFACVYAQHLTIRSSLIYRPLNSFYKNSPSNSNIRSARFKCLKHSKPVTFLTSSYRGPFIYWFIVYFHPLNTCIAITVEIHFSSCYCVVGDCLPIDIIIHQRNYFWIAATNNIISLSYLLRLFSNNEGQM